MLQKIKILDGILSSADLRKAIMNKNILDKTIEKIYNKNQNLFILMSLIQNGLFNIKKINIIPVIDKKTKKF